MPSLSSARYTARVYLVLTTNPQAEEYIVELREKATGAMYRASFFVPRRSPYAETSSPDKIFICPNPDQDVVANIAIREEEDGRPYLDMSWLGNHVRMECVTTDGVPESAVLISG